MEFFKLFLTDNFPEEKINLLQCITFEHYTFFQNQVDTILFDEKVLMTSEEEKFFRKNKEILRTISQTNFSDFVGYYLGSHINLVKEVVKVTHKNNEPHSNSGAGSSRNMEKTQPKDARSDEESSDTEPSSPESLSFREDEEEEEEDNGFSTNSSCAGDEEHEEREDNGRTSSPEREEED